MLLGFEELKRVNFRQARSLAEILAQSLGEHIDGPDAYNGDKQCVYYILKISDLIYYKDSEVKITMMGNAVSNRPLLELFYLKEELRKKVSKFSFWEVYYRHNNYFYDNNLTIFKHLRIKGTEKGIEEMVGKGKFLQGDDFLKTVFRKDKDRISSWGVRACSLNDIIRFMIYLRLELEDINHICEEITETYKMDRKMAYRVFKETEDEFSIRNYIPAYIKKNEIEKGEDRLILALQKTLEFLEPSESLNILVLNSNILKKLKNPFIKNILQNYQLDNSLRRVIWPCLLSDVITSIIAFRRRKSYSSNPKKIVISAKKKLSLWI